MRIWVLTNEYSGNIIGGLGVVATHLSKALAKRSGLHVTVICKGSNRSVTVTNRSSLKVIRFPNQSRYHSRSTQTFHAAPIVEWLDLHGIPRPDLIHIHSLECDELAAFCKRHFLTPVIYTCHSVVMKGSGQLGRTRNAERQENLIGMSDAVTAPSEWLKLTIRQFCPYYPGEIRVIRNGVTGIAGDKRRRASRYRLLYVGRLTRIKGIEEMLRAVRSIKKKEPRVKLHLIGGGASRYSSRLKALSRKLRLSRTVKWLGKHTPRAVQRKYRFYGAVVVPSKNESFGLVALEAMANGVPLVASRNGGLGSFVHEGNAQVIEKVTAPSIAAAIRQMWSQPALTARRVEHATDTVRSYKWVDIASHYQELFLRYRKG